MERSPWLERSLLLVATAITVWGLASFGLWDPWELEPTTGADIAFSWLGASELSARLPNALGGLVLLATAFVLLQRSCSQRAGFVALAVLASTPLFLLNARLAMGDAMGMAAQAWVGAAAIGASRPQDPSERSALLLALLVTGALLSARLSGVLLGPLPPLLAVAAWQWVGDTDAEHPIARWAAPATVFLLLAGVIHAVVEDAPDHSVWLGGGAVGGEPPSWDAALELAFHGFAPWSAAVPIAALSTATPRRDRNPITQRLAWILLLWLAFGIASWTLFASRYGTPPFLTLLPLAGLLAIWLDESLEDPSPRWPAAVVVALLVGLLIRDYALYPDSALRALAADALNVPELYRPTVQWAAGFGLAGGSLSLFLVSPSGSARPSSRRTVEWLTHKWDEGWPRRGWMVIALSLLSACVVFGAMCFVLDMRIASIVVRAGRHAFFAPLLVAALIFGLPWLRYGFSRLGAARIVVVSMSALTVGAFVSLSFQPELSRHFSPKSVFDTYEELAHDSPGPLVAHGVSTSSSRFYTDAIVERIDDRDALLELLGEGAQRWVILEAERLPELNRAYRRAYGRHLYVADAAGARLLLASAMPIEGRPNESFIADTVLDDAPEPEHRVGATFDEYIELIGYDLELPESDSVGAGQRFTLTWYWKAIGEVPTGYEVFVHIDGNGLRLNGDHGPVADRYPTRLWEPGDIVVDTQTLSVPPNFRPGDYTIHVGLFKGSKRLEVSSGQSDGSDRARAGVLPVR
jgi:hypothetical protein